MTDCTLPAPDPIELNALRFEGSTLQLDVSYSGGCTDHEYQLCWNGSFGDGFAPEATMKLGHDAFDDMCEAVISETVHIDASTLIDAAGGVAFNARVMVSSDVYVATTYTPEAP